jgi:DNA-directed RNA polymerase specialized sigma24 family protein
LDDIAEPSLPVRFDLVELDDALEILARKDPRAARIVELRFFVGLSVEETAAVLETSRATVKREWRVARLWLFQTMKHSDKVSPD